MFYVYILGCADGSLYVGHTRNIRRCVETHNAGFGASFTYKRLPVRLVFSEAHPTRVTAVRRERQLKGWSRKKKEALIQGDFDRLRVLSRRRE